MRTRNTEQEDYLLRMIQEVGRALARLREMLQGSANAGPAVRAEVAQSTELLLGADAPMLEQLDAVSAARLLGSRARVELWAQLLDLEAETWAGEGAAERATAATVRAAALRAASAATENEPL